MSTINGYFPTTQPAAAPTYTQTTAPAPLAGATISDSWIPTSSANPYTSGMRSAGAAVAAVSGAKAASVHARWAKMLSFRSKAGYDNGIQSIAGAKNVDAKIAWLDKPANLNNQVKVPRPGPFSAVRHTFLSPTAWFKAGIGAALIAIPMSLINNYMDYKSGLINEQQRNVLFVADAAGYTATGAIATLAAGAAAATFLGAMGGTVIGIGAGLGLGYLYEKFIRPRWGEWVRNAMYPAGAPAPTPAPTPVPVPQPPAPTPPPPPDDWWIAK